MVGIFGLVMVEDDDVVRKASKNRTNEIQEIHMWDYITVVYGYG